MLSASSSIDGVAVRQKGHALKGLRSFGAVPWRPQENPAERDFGYARPVAAATPHPQ